MYKHDLQARFNSFMLLRAQEHVQGFTVVVQPQASSLPLHVHCMGSDTGHYSGALKRHKITSLVGVCLVRALGAGALTLSAGTTFACEITSPV